jgi:hypothetical protein
MRKIIIGEFTFFSLTDVLAENMKDEHFKKAYEKEIKRFRTARRLKLLPKKNN